MDCKVSLMTQEEDAALREFLEEQQRKNYIQPLISPYASPFFFIKKKNGKLRPVQDYQKLNHITIQNMAPVPRALEHIHDLGGALYYTKIDVRSVSWTDCLVRRLYGLPLGPFLFLSTTFHSHAYCTITCSVDDSFSSLCFHYLRSYDSYSYP